MSAIFENADSVVMHYASLLEKPLENYAGYMVTKALDEFSLQLVQYRLNNRLNQTELARKLGISQSMVSQYEAGTNNVTVKRMCEICESIGVRVQIGFEKANAISGAESDGIYRFDRDNSSDVA